MPVWGDFEVDLQSVIGRGGMSTVYQGRQISLNRRVAIKVLKGDLVDESPDFIQRFHREAELLAKLVDERIVQVYGAGQRAGLYFYAMEYVEGEDLGKKLARKDIFPESRVIEIGMDVCRALEVAWKHKIIHRDIKPTNIVITQDGQTKVMDFGLAKNIDASQTRSDIIMGTPRYVSPEQAVGQPCDIRSDLYSMGIVLYELATSQIPFDAPEVSALLYKHVYEAPRHPRELRPELSEGLCQILLRLLQKKPENRYATPSELRQDLERVAAGQSTPTVPTPTLQQKTLGPRPARLKVAVALMGVLVAAAGVLVFGFWDTIVEEYSNFLLARQLSSRPPGSTNGEMHGPRPDPGRSSPNGNGPVDPPPPPPPPPPIDPDAAAKEKEFRQNLQAGRDALAIGNWETAILKLTAALGYSRIDETQAADIRLKIEDAKFNIAMDRGQKAMDAEKYDEAIDQFNAASSLRPKSQAEGRMRRATCLKHQKQARELETGNQWDLAARQYEAALQFAEDPVLLERYRDMCVATHEGISAFNAGELKKAREKINQALAFGRHESTLRGVLANVEKAIVEEEARLEQERRKAWEEHVRTGAEAFRAARWRDAFEAYEKAAGLPYDAEKTLKELGRCKRALAAPAGMKYVPDGDFLMGSQEGRDVERPAHSASTGEFYIDEREVTRAQYAKFLSEFKDHSKCHPKEPRGKDHTPLRWADQTDPNAAVSGVDWYDAWSYLAHLGRRLPSEAEFEKAASWDSLREKKNVYPWGNVYQKEGGPSFFGCEEMGSGLLEWTSDFFRAYPGSTAQSALFGERFIAVRGGVNFSEDAKENTRTFSRFNYIPGARSAKIGFRGVKDAAP
jgi:serine/threonine protein kinase/formylglycine-generating enzyme required for sulfatase activity